MELWLSTKILIWITIILAASVLLFIFAYTIISGLCRYKRSKVSTIKEDFELESDFLFKKSKTPTHKLLNVE